MNRIEKAFKNGKAFISFITAGDPDLNKTSEFIKVMEKAGADLIELGIPFSDPVAEGAVIQRANIRALEKGVTPAKIFDMVQSVRNDVSVPLVFLTYLNPVFNYGYEKFMQKCAECGIDGLIIPDMPYEERGELLEYSKKYHVALISLVAPTSADRISMIAHDAEGFIYCVSSLGVTGVRSTITTDLRSIIKVIRSASDKPIAVGFGISTPEQVKEIVSYSDGVIVGSAIVKIIEKYGNDAAPYIADYVKSMKSATNGE